MDTRQNPASTLACADRDDQLKQLSALCLRRNSF